MRTATADVVGPSYSLPNKGAGFAQAVLDVALTWISAAPLATRALGNKSNAKAPATEQGVPYLPGYAGDDQSDEQFTAEAEKIGYPLMVRTMAGGGGRGMRLMTDERFCAGQAPISYLEEHGTEIRK